MFKFAFAGLPFVVMVERARMDNVIDMDILDSVNIFEGLDPEKDKWDALIEAAFAGNVVPVIGPDILCTYDNGVNLNQFVISTIEDQLKMSKHHDTFSQLVYDPEFVGRMIQITKNPYLTRDCIYVLVDNIFKDPKNVEKKFQPSEVLMRLLSVKLFPFVITTSFSPVVENAMRQVWSGQKVSVRYFSNDPDKDQRVGIGDIGYPEEMSLPTVYYMFGRSTGMAHRYVLTDDDMLAFCKSWMSPQSRPNHLCDQLKDKYLLMLGCGYSDWLFRFIWYCMNKTSDTKTKGMIVHDKNTNESLVEYLRRIDTFLPENTSPHEIVDEIVKRISGYNDEHRNEWLSRPVKCVQVFISYSRRDSDIVDRLYDSLTNQGLSVWYDKYDLFGGVKFEDEIERSIKNAKVFVPVITRNVAKEAMSSHMYRKEWKTAIEQQETSGDHRTFIIPIHEKGFDMYSADIPKEIKRLNSIEFGEDGDFSALISSINKALDQLDNFNTDAKL